MKDIFIHVGYPKTGTTFLQQKVFENLKVTKSFGKPKIEENMKFIMNSICKDDEITFESNKELLLEKLRLIQFREKNIISLEEFTSCLDINNYNLIQIQDRLFNIFDKLSKKDFRIKIILVLRNQKDIVLSYYTECYEKIIKVNSRWTNFKNFLNKFKNNDEKNLIIDSFNYNLLIRQIYKYYPKQNVKILFYEDFKSNIKDFINDLLIFIDDNLDNNYELKNYKVNHSFKDKNQNYRKLKKNYLISFLSDKIFTNLFIKKFLYNIYYFLKTTDKVKLDINQQKMIINYFKDDNVCLEKETGIKLKKDYFEI